MLEPKKYPTGRYKIERGQKYKIANAIWHVHSIWEGDGYHRDSDAVVLWIPSIAWIYEPNCVPKAIPNWKMDNVYLGAMIRKGYAELVE